MSIYKVILLVAGVLCLCTAVLAQRPDRRALLAGEWTGTATRSDGISAQATMTLSNDGSFHGHVSVNGQIMLTYEGTWALEGDRVQWTYTKSSRELPLKIDTDDLVSVTRDKLVLRSHLSQELRTFQRPLWKD